MAKIEIYTSPFCGYCYRAKSLLEDKDVTFIEIDVIQQPSKRLEMIDRADGEHTVPQIFINDKPVGGCDDLFALDDKGKLDALLTPEAPA